MSKDSEEKGGTFNSLTNCKMKENQILLFLVIVKFSKCSILRQAAGCQVYCLRVLSL